MNSNSLFFVACSLLAVGCGPNKPGVAQCAELKPESSALEARYANNPAIDARTSVFVQAAKDVAWSSTTLEQEVSGACRRIGADIGVPLGQMIAQKGPGGGAVGACDPVNIQLQNVLSNEGIRLWVTVGAPACRPNNNAWQRCASRCDPRGDPYCNVACRAHAQVHANCTRAHVRARAMQGGEKPNAAKLVATLEANLPAMVHAQLAMGERLAPEINGLRDASGGASAKIKDKKASDCMASSRRAISDASKRTRLSIRTSRAVVNQAQGR